jgi:histidinol-phosphate aminotransferase
MTRTTPASLLDLARPDLLAMAGYEPVEPVEAIAARFDIPPERIAKLDGNENPYGPCQAAAEAAGRAAFELYCDPDQRALRGALARYTGVPAGMIVAGHGSDELIDLVARALLAPGDNIIECSPTFGMYRFTAAVCGAAVRDVPRRGDFTLDLDGLRTAVDERSKLIFLPSPNNPTGNLLSRQELEACLALGPAVVVDEAYVEFAGLEHSHIARVARQQQLIVLRTFSKWAALAGLRLGYAVMPEAFADLLRVIKPPYTPNVAAEAAGIASLQQREALMEHVRAIVAERERLLVELAAIDYLQPLPSQANFLLCRVVRGDARRLRDELRRRGVFVRYFGSGSLRDSVRISVGRRRESDLLLAALREIQP